MLKDIGVDKAPVMILDKKAGIEDEISFNLAHNSIEKAGSVITVPLSEEEGYIPVRWQDIEETDQGDNMSVLGRCGRLVVRFGAWGSIVADPETGRVIANTDYAAICRRQHLDCLVYYPPVDHVEDLERILHEEFGTYDASRVMKNTWQQFAIQPIRLVVGKKTGRGASSTTYEELVLQRITKETRFLDFGAGRQAYVKMLREKGFRISAYEPFLIVKVGAGKRQFDLPKIVADISMIETEVRRSGLFEGLVLDSVLNASSTEDYHLWITVAASALLDKAGELYVGTRGYGKAVGETAGVAGGGFQLRARYMTPEGRSVAFRNSQWTTIRFHTRESLKDWLERFFTDVEIRSTREDEGNLKALARGPKPLPEALVRTALEEEFNMLYPGDYKHGRHLGLIEAVVDRLYSQDRICLTEEFPLRPPLAIGTAALLEVSEG